MTDAGAELRFGIDRLVVSGRRLFGWGWLAHPGRVVHEVHLGVRGDGWRKRLAAQSGILREDVREAFPRLEGARFAGFVVTGYVPDPQIRGLSLEATYDDGSSEVFEVGTAVEVNEAARASRYTLARLWRALLRRLRSGDWRALFSRPDSANASLPSLDDRDGASVLAETLSGARDIRIIFDHDMGGGANQYRREAVARWAAEGTAAVLCTYSLPALDYRIRILVANETERELRAPSFVALEPLLQDARVSELFVNSPVSFGEPLVFADWLARMKARRPQLRLTLTAHDYFPVCPSFVLLNSEGRFCGVPDVAECERCLARHTAAHVAFSPPTTITAWRESWGRALAAADEVRFFSEASRALFVRAYPELAAGVTTTVVPHRVEFAPRRPRVSHAGTLVIGVAGKLNFQKGAHVVAEMARRIERDAIDARIVVLGALEIPARSPRLEVTGPYAPEDLPRLVEEHGINLFFFPSIWPETFSYVVAEIGALGVPIVAFDLGAPAERLRSNPLARLVGRVDADAALDTLLEFHRGLARNAAAAA
jgi:glycosyltransferase involved in cell wall biosynthesis